MLRGSIVALVTPMKADGAVDFEALESLVEWHIAEGTHGIVPMGTTGESPTLDTPEHLVVIRRTIEVAAGRVPVIAGTGSNSTQEAIHQTQEAERLGADACLLVTPYYNRPTQEGLYRHYRAIADVTRVPLVLYNVPPRTACDLKPETVARLAEIESIVGIKEACGNPDRVTELKAVVPEDFIILSGEDAQTLRMMTLGAVGTISVTANVVPRLMAEFCSAYLDGNLDKAREIDARLQPLHKFLFVETSPAPVKWALHEMGRIDRGIRLPLVELSEPHRPELRRLLKEVGAL
ncbi:MAG TPA: 4-hydroxy-tetrahydrodipicolinate synthase [Pseudomonadales bacterium]